MNLYTVTVNLNGSSDNQVILHNVTAAEIRLLQYIHGKSENGKEPVVDIEHTAETTRNDRQERSRLLDKYRELELGKGAAIIEQIFGVAGVPLPQVYEAPVFAAVEEAVDEDSQIDEVVTPIEKPKAVAAPKPSDIKRTKVEKIEASV